MVKNTGYRLVSRRVGAEAGINIITALHMADIFTSKLVFGLKCTMIPFE